MLENVIAGFIGSVAAGIILWWLRKKLEAKFRNKPSETSRQLRGSRPHGGECTPSRSRSHPRSRNSYRRIAYRIIEWPLRLSFIASGAFGTYAVLVALTGVSMWIWAVPGFVLGGWLQAYLLENVDVD